MARQKNRDPYSGPIVTLDEARSEGLLRYFTGKPCKHGHICERKVASNSCLYCNYDHQIKYLSEHPGWKSQQEARQAAGLVIPMAIRSAESQARRAADPDKRHYRRGKARGTVPVVRRRFTDDERLARKRERERAQRAAARAQRPPKVELSPEEREERVRIQRRAANRRRKERRKAARLTAKPRRRSKSKASRSGERYRKANRRARKAGAVGRHTQADMDEIFLKQKKRCAICGLRVTEKDRSNDHIVPLAKGGTNDRTNMQVVHFLCNSVKRDLDPIEHMQMVTRDRAQPKFL